MKEYRVKLCLYVGLTHGSGRPHYSVRQLKAALCTSRMSGSSVTLTEAIGTEGGMEEDTVIIHIMWPLSKTAALSPLCAQLNDFLRRLFSELGQRWILVNVITSSARGKPLLDKVLRLDPVKKPSIILADLIPAQSPAGFTTVLILLPGLSADGVHYDELERKVLDTTWELAARFGGCSASQHLSGQGIGYWLDQRIVGKSVTLVEVAVAGAYPKVRRVISEYVREHLLARFQQEAIVVKFVRARGEAISVPVH